MIEILGTLRQVYSNRVNKNGLYGTGSSKAVIAEGDQYVRSRAVTELDREDPEQLSMLIMIMILCGTFFALRGQKEHSLLGIHIFEVDTSTDLTLNFRACNSSP